jgi:hypothetical protein
VALLEQHAFGVIAFEWPNRGQLPWPAEQSEADVGRMVEALRNVAGGHLLVGRVEDRGIAAVLPEAKPQTLRSVLAAATAEEQRLRAEGPDDGLRAPVAAGEICHGSLHGETVFAALRAKLGGAGAG